METPQLLSGPQISLKTPLGFKRRTFTRGVRWWLKHNQPVPATHVSDLPIDIFTPLLTKDLPVFRQSARYARKNIKHPIKNHFVVGPETPELVQACREEGCVFVPEAEVLGMSLQEFKNVFRGGQSFERAGWLYQQFLKLSADNISDCEAVLILDGDTVFVSPVTFEYKGRYVVETADGFAAEYDIPTSKLLGTSKLSPFSFVSHHLLFRKKLLASLKQDLERRFNHPWVQAIGYNLDYENFFPFSEYQLYGNWAILHAPREHILSHWRNEALKLPTDVSLIESMLAKKVGIRKSISLHHYLRVREPHEAKPTQKTGEEQMMLV